MTHHLGGEGFDISAKARTRTPNAASTAILEATLDELARVGPVHVHPQDICERLGLSKALVNYHFGSRDALIAEAMVVGYERYVADLWAAAEAQTDPVERLFAWIDRQFAWTEENVGLASALNFPKQTTNTDGMSAELAERIAAAGAQNFWNTMQLVSAARKHLNGDPEDHADDAMTAGVIGWTVLGMSVFNAGKHLPTKDLWARDMIPAVRAHMRELVIRLLSRPGA